VFRTSGTSGFPAKKICVFLKSGNTNVTPLMNFRCLKMPNFASKCIKITRGSVNTSVYWNVNQRKCVFIISLIATCKPYKYSLFSSFVLDEVDWDLSVCTWLAKPSPRSIIHQREFVGFIWLSIIAVHTPKFAMMRCPLSFIYYTTSRWRYADRTPTSRQPDKIEMWAY
jgi:hypothetical protein